MDKIYIGNRPFLLGTIPPSTLEVLTEKIKGLTILDLDSEGKTDVGDAILFILTAIFDGDEEKALEVGQELAQTEIENVKVEQLCDAIELIRKNLEG
ncbi:hypothetical protein NXX36_19520 [Bacteroides fragilis]|uniref:hypothetical protein n=1 Tax=Bacteroides fragilis TaxID=817 RepID=UPI001FA1F1B1|nr:hypothetical protein [Bacteroides fragilis]MCE8578602.1 hypothetical protein [Bacteroides fragilis]MCE8649039.1 hypothetical protein [Bacteroides fragilis]MCM0348996.1 hypothetical protein [Bacteroides fragilis]MCM0367878.1 hypothetical protein [Bacteroides fragilis]MCS2538189.1 hypothetical protein [Bacteroides fragilis]